MGIKWAEYTEKTALYENDRVTKAQLQKSRKRRHLN